MKIWTDKQGNKLTIKEFISRWEEGIKGISPYDITKHQLRGMKIILLGLLCGIVICLFNLKNLWWLLIILIGGFYVNITQYIGTWQKLKALQMVEDQLNNMKGGLEDE